MAAKIIQCSAVVIALLVLSTSGAVAQVYDRKSLIDLFETALLDSDALWTLQKIFFDPDSKQSPEKVCLPVSVSVEDIADPDVDYCEFDSEGEPAFIYDDTSDTWYFDSYYVLHQQVADDVSDTHELANLITKSGSASIFYSFDPSFYTIMQTQSSSIALMFPYDDDDSDYSSDYAYINIAELDGMPCWSDAVYAMRSVLMWAKFYAKPNISGTQRSIEYSDRSSVSDGVRFSEHYEADCQSPITSFLIQPSNAWILVLGIFYFSNLLLLTSTLLYFRKVFLWLQRQNKQTKTLYKASAAVLTCVNMIALISDFSIIIHNNIQSEADPDSDVILIMVLIMFPTKVMQVLLILILEMPVACFNTHLPNQPTTRHQRFAHAFALCQIIWFVHRLVNDAIISVIFFVLAPAQTIGMVTLLLATIASAIVFVAILIHNFKGCSRKMCTFMICVTLNGLIICGLLLAITLLYIVLVDNGLKSAGMGGLILSLVPLVPLAAFIIGFIIKQKYFNTNRSPTTMTATCTPERGEPNQAMAIQMDDNEGNSERTPLLLQSARHNGTQHVTS